MLSPTNNASSYHQSRQHVTAHVKLWLSRLLRSFPFSLWRRIPLPLLLLVGVEWYWIFFDRYVTSQQYFAPPRQYIPPTESSPLSPYYDPNYDPYHGPIRAYPPHEFPCSTLMQESQYLVPSGSSSGPTTSAPGPTSTDSTGASNLIRPLGFYCLLQPRVASTTMASITARIARNVAQRKHPTSSTTPTNQTVCSSWMAMVTGKRFKQRNVDESFLWTMVREPVHRMVSHFSHVAVSRFGKDPTLDQFRSYLQETVRLEYGSYFRTMSPRRYMNPHRQDMWRTYVDEILSFYNFVGIVERWDESLAVLQLLLGLETQDLLSWKVRSSSVTGGASYIPDDTASTTTTSSSSLEGKRCIKLKPVQITLSWKEYLHQPFLFEEVFEADVYVYKAMNASLDATISSLGQAKVDQAVKQLQWAQQQMEAGCAEQIVFPCTAEGQPQSTTDCLVADVGCGSTCIDEVGKSLSSSPHFAEI